MFLYGVVGVVLLGRFEVREMDLELGGVGRAELLLGPAVTANRAARRLGETLDLVRRLLRARAVERGEERGRVHLAGRRLTGVTRDHRDLATRQHVAGVAGTDGHDIERVPEVFALGRRVRLPEVVDDGADQRRGYAPGAR